MICLYACILLCQPSFFPAQTDFDQAVRIIQAVPFPFATPTPAFSPELTPPSSSLLRRNFGRSIFTLWNSLFGTFQLKQMRIDGAWPEIAIIFFCAWLFLSLVSVQQTLSRLESWLRDQRGVCSYGHKTLTLHHRHVAQSHSSSCDCFVLFFADCAVQHADRHAQRCVP